MPELDDTRNQLDAAADALTARRSLYAALAALAADPFDLGQALLLPLLQRRAREADHTLSAVLDAHAMPWPPTLPASPPDHPLTSLQRRLADADDDDGLL
ncbi:hypothetical protein [Haloactinopolyspora sp.]|uniref:hypothetical protein n=1 Tax=Haloactinopolyspora sp. TaxID=1966353 RepID=UPI00260E21AA|nr:hypothetical protein [Haloactinopolyspora sp.]